MRYRELGRTRLLVSEVGLGTWALGGSKYGNSYGPTDDGESARVLWRALDLGCTFFDTADVYGHGHAERLLGTALLGRGDIIIATKVGAHFYGDRVRRDFSPAYIRFACDQSLRRLRRDYIDLYQMHDPTVEDLTNPSIAETLEELKAAGKIRFYGASIPHDGLGLAALRHGTLDTIQVAYNLLSPEAEFELLPEAAASNIGVVVREPLGNGFLAGKYAKRYRFPIGDIRGSLPRSEVLMRVNSARSLRFLTRHGARTPAQAAIRFCLDHSVVSTVVPGAKTVAQVEDNLGSSDVLPLSDGERALAMRSLFGLA